MFNILKRIATDNSYCLLFRMASTMTVRCVPDNERLSISFTYGHNGATPKEFRMERLKDEEIGRLLDRIKCSIQSKFVNRKRKKESSEVNNGEIELILKINGSENVDSVKGPIQDVLKQGTLISINDSNYEVSVNPPTVTILRLPKNIMDGFPVCPKATLQFSDIDDCEFIWNRVPDNFETFMPASRDKLRTPVCNQRMYTPTVHDIGHKLEVFCTAKLGENTGNTLPCVSSNLIQAGPGLCPFEMRHLYTADTTDENSFRILSYNILADVFADTDFTKTELFPYCSPYALALDYRIQLLFKEILGYKGDILCLQEVDKKVFEEYLTVSLGMNGYSGLFKMKTGKVREGEAIFYRHSKFRLVSEHNISITEEVQDETYKDILEKVNENEGLKEMFFQRTNILQVCVLESVTSSNRKVCVANTHLFFHKHFDHIRLIQGAVCLQHLEKVMENYRKQGDKVSLIFCGDMNAVPSSPLMSFISKGEIDPEKHSLVLKSTGEKLLNLKFTHNLNLQSGCGYPDYTNYVAHFHGHLDYILHDESLEVLNVVPPPDHDQVTLHKALPSVVFPSDHIAQICDMKWK